MFNNFNACHYFTSRCDIIWYNAGLKYNFIHTYEPQHETSNNVVCATSKFSDQPAHTSSLIRAFASRLNILWVLSYLLNIIWSFLNIKGGYTGLSESNLSKCHIVVNHMSEPICNTKKISRTGTSYCWNRKEFLAIRRAISLNETFVLFCWINDWRN